MALDKQYDFFISYNQADRFWADWIGCQLEANDFRVFHPGWDIHAGQNEVYVINQFLENVKNQQGKTRILLLFSPNFGENTVVETLWQDVKKIDPSGELGLNIPVLIKDNAETKIPNFLNSNKKLNLSSFGENEEAKATTVLVKHINGGRAKVNFHQDENYQFPPSIAASQKNTLNNEQRKRLIQLIGCIDKSAQSSPIVANAKAALSGETKKPVRPQTFAYLISGHRSEWPEAIIHKLYQQFKAQLTIDAEITSLDRRGQDLLPGQSAPEFLWEFFKNCCSPTADNVASYLSEQKTTHLFFRTIARSTQEREPQFLTDLIKAWVDLRLKSTSHNHFLILINSESAKPASEWWRVSCGRNHTYTRLQRKFSSADLSSYLLTELQSPIPNDIRDWLQYNFFDVDRATLEKAIETVIKKHTKLKAWLDQDLCAELEVTKPKKQQKTEQAFRKRFGIPHAVLKDILTPLLEKFD